MSPNNTLRLLREHLNLSIQEVADATELSFRTVLRAEQGAPLNPDSRRRLCAFYGKTPEELGLVPRRRGVKTAPLSTNDKRAAASIHSVTQRGDERSKGTGQEPRQQADWNARGGDSSLAALSIHVLA